MRALENKVAVVTGASGGIGRVSALALAEAGAAVVIGNRRTDEGEATAALIRERGGRATFVKTDVSVAGEVDALVARAVEEFGGLDIAFNNAGVEGALGPMLEQTDENFDFVFGVNVKGVLRSMRAQAAAMRARGGGVILNNSSVAGRKGFPGMSVYAASKHAVEGLTKTAALELAAENIRVNAVSPGPIRTDMMNRVTGGDESGFEAMVPMGRVGESEEIASLVVFLAGDGASYITGQSYAVDGGVAA